MWIGRPLLPFPPLPSLPFFESNLVHYNLKIWDLMVTILIILLRISWPATAGLLVNFGHTLSVGLLVRPWPYRPYRRRRPCEMNGDFNWRSVHCCSYASSVCCCRWWRRLMSLCRECLPLHSPTPFTVFMKRTTLPTEWSCFSRRYHVCVCVCDIST